MFAFFENMSVLEVTNLSDKISHLAVNIKPHKTANLGLAQ